VDRFSDCSSFLICSYPLCHELWDLKEKPGEQNMPDNFIEYFAGKIAGYDFSPAFVSTVIAVSFSVAALVSIHVNFIHSKLKRKKHQAMNQNYHRQHK
jgi:hypothetical protein